MKWKTICYQIMENLEKNKKFEKSLRIINAIKFNCPIYNELEHLVKDKYDYAYNKKYKQIELF